jgi:hypothetical protein
VNSEEVFLQGFALGDGIMKIPIKYVVNE